MRTVLRLLIASAALVALATPVRADVEGDSGTGTGAYLDPTDGPTVEVSDVVTVAGGGQAEGGSEGDGDCFWRVAIEDDTAQGVFDVDGTQLFSDTGRWLELICDGSVQVVDGMGIVAEGSDPVQQVDPAELAREARASIPVPAPGITTSPDADRQTYAQVTTWLWLDPSWWRSYSATATAGRVSATVTATPVRAAWATGDGNRVDCHGPGVVWRRGLSDDDTYCSHVYRRSSTGSGGGAFPLSVTVTFDVEWTSNVGRNGTLDGLARTASRSIRVGEIQAIETE